MAVDAALLREAAEGVLSPTLRLYTWSPPAVSLGRFQRPDGIDVEYVRRRGWDLVRRPTGGRAVLHQYEQTYSITLPPGVVGGAGVRTSYAVLVGMLNAGLESLIGRPLTSAVASAPDLPLESSAPSPVAPASLPAYSPATAMCSLDSSPVGMPALRVTGSEAGSGHTAGGSSGFANKIRDAGATVRLGAAVEAPITPGGCLPTANCFDTAAECDTLLGEGKLVGSAQARLGGALLQHGSILLDAEPAAWEALFGATGRLLTLSQLLPRRPAAVEVSAALLAGFHRSGVQFEGNGSG
jgi:lipoate-protein ligase A